MPDAIIIGGGGIGVASAYYLDKHGWDVTLIDKGELGHACSYANSCLVVPSHSDPIPAPGVISQAMRWMVKKDSPFFIRPRLDPQLLRFFLQFRRFCTEEAAAHGFDALLSLSRASLELFGELLDTGDARFFFERKGLIEVFLSEQGSEHGRRAKDALAAHGFRSMTLERDEVIDLEPAVAPTIRGGLFIEGEAHGYSYEYVRSLAATAEDNGVTILSGREVSSIHVEGRRVRGVELEGPRQRLDAELVVLAAGAWSRKLARQVGLDIPMQPAKGYSATIDSYDGAPIRPILVKERRVIVTPLDTRLRFGGTLELAGFDHGIHGDRYEAVKRGGCEVLKTPPPMENEAAWSGLRPVTPDGLPVIGRPKHLDGLIAATGHAMLGFTQSPITGKLVAQIASEEAPSVPVEPFRLDRF